MAAYSVTWVGDKVRSYTTKAGQSYKSCRIAVRDENGNRITKLEISRPADREVPEVGDEIVGAIKPHAKFDDLSVFVEGATGEAPSSTSGGPPHSPAETSRTESIERQVALKVAGVVVASYVGQGAIKPDEFGEYIEKFTQAGVDALRGRKDAEGETDKPENGKAELDSDIPF